MKKGRKKEEEGGRRRERKGGMKKGRKGEGKKKVENLIRCTCQD